jgi:hypothetical protein
VAAASVRVFSAPALPTGSTIRLLREWRVDLAALIAATPELDWLLLTKRPENYKKLAPWVALLAPRASHARRPEYLR